MQRSVRMRFGLTIVMLTLSSVGQLTLGTGGSPMPVEEIVIADAGSDADEDAASDGTIPEAEPEPLPRLTRR
jgi:hypothetical protein